jgi:hypothetical protein
MTPLRQRMTDAMLQRGFAACTQANYVKAIYGMAKYYRRDPGGYTHRTAISNERIRSVGQSEVAFNVRADDQGGKRVLRLPGVEFVRRFMQHVLPTGIKRIRHYGVLVSACKAVRLDAARLALRMPVINPQAVESAHTFMARVLKLDVSQCPCCKTGRLYVAATLAGLRQLPSPSSTLLPQVRAPP